MLAVNIWFWVGFIGFVLAMLALDLGVFHRHPHEVKPREAGIWVAIWVTLALAFAGGLYLWAGHKIVVMVLIFEYFRVPKTCQHRALFYGILGALVMRGLFIAAGSAIVSRFSWVLYVFGALLIVTGIRMAMKGDDEFDGEQNRIVRTVRRYLPISADYHGKNFFTIENGRRIATPLLLVLILVEFTDLIFAIDSIPAIFGVTTDPFIVFTSNIFAVMGLRSLYFLLAAVVDRFHLLKYGLAVILTFVGLKMLTEHWIQIDITMSLAIILGVLTISIVASLVWPARKGAEG
jgi:tellurite resistance protein TerC